MAEKSLISLEEHNAMIRECCHDWVMNEPRPNGISCPRCEKELFDSAPNMVLASNPPQKNVHCRCGYRGYRLA